MINKIIFPSPKPSYTTGHPQLYWVPRNLSNTKDDFIPILWCENLPIYNKLLIFFHGNAEDNEMALDFVECVGEELKVY